MSKSSEAANSVVKAVIEAAEYYRVPWYRMQSSVFRAESQRPIFIGKWVDRFGEEHSGGMTDLLLTPVIRLTPNANGIQVPLWVECKHGSGKLSPQQQAFCNDVIARGGFHLLARDCADAVLNWFKQWGVRR